MKEKFRREKEMHQMELILDVVNDFIVLQPDWMISRFKLRMKVKGAELREEGKLGEYDDASARGFGTIPELLRFPF